MPTIIAGLSSRQQQIKNFNFIESINNIITDFYMYVIQTCHGINLNFYLFYSFKNNMDFNTN